MVAIVCQQDQSAEVLMPIVLDLTADEMKYVAVLFLQACELGFTTATRHILDRYPLFFKYYRDFFSTTSWEGLYLYTAARSQKREMLRFLVNRGANINSVSILGVTVYEEHIGSALYGALEVPLGERLSMLQFLVDELHVAIPTVEQTCGGSSIDLVVRNTFRIHDDQALEIVQFLLSHGAAASTHAYFECLKRRFTKTASAIKEADKDINLYSTTGVSFELEKITMGKRSHTYGVDVTSNTLRYCVSNGIEGEDFSDSQEAGVR